LTKQEVIEYLSNQDNYELGEHYAGSAEIESDEKYLMKIIEDERFPHTEEEWSFLAYPYSNYEPIDETFAFVVWFDKKTEKAYCSDAPLLSLNT